VGGFKLKIESSSGRSSEDEDDDEKGSQSEEGSLQSMDSADEYASVDGASDKPDLSQFDFGKDAAPWQCLACNNSNPPHHVDQCKRCGALRRALTPEIESRRASYFGEDRYLVNDDLYAKPSRRPSALGPGQSSARATPLPANGGHSKLGSAQSSGAALNPAAPEVGCGLTAPNGVTHCMEAEEAPELPPRPVAGLAPLVAPPLGSGQGTAATAPLPSHASPGAAELPSALPGKNLRPPTEPAPRRIERKRTLPTIRSVGSSPVSVDDVDVRPGQAPPESPRRKIILHPTNPFADQMSEV
jgi:hypothetical protein